MSANVLTLLAGSLLGVRVLVRNGGEKYLSPPRHLGLYRAEDEDLGSCRRLAHFPSTGRGFAVDHSALMCFQLLEDDTSTLTNN